MGDFCAEVCFVDGEAHMKGVGRDGERGGHSAGSEILPLEMFGCGDGDGIGGMV